MDITALSRYGMSEMVKLNFKINVIIETGSRILPHTNLQPTNDVKYSKKGVE